MINAGNDYALANADFITNLVLHGNQYAIIDEFVPFYGIALHGFVNYAGTPVNLAYEEEQLILESAEVAAGLYFSFMKAPSEKIQETYYTDYYSSNFDAWKSKFADIYRDYNSKLAPVMNSPICGHEYVGENVTKTTFENGYEIYVNFGYANYMTPSGKFIPGRDYRVVKVED